MKGIKAFGFSVLLIFMIGAANVSALMASPAKDTMVVNAANSDTGIQPFVPGQAPNQWFYHYVCVASGASIEDTLHISLRLGNERGDSTPVISTVSFSVHGNPTLRDAVSVPSPVSVTAGGSTVFIDFPISTGSLADGVYVANIQLSVSPASKVQLAHDTIHIQVRVGGDGCAAPPTCFITDSAFGALLDCSGNPVALESSFGGTFAIVYNAKKTVVSTNPGQFYYNLIWTNNTGDSHDISLTMSKSDATLKTTGTNALHVAVFESGDLDPANPLVSQFDAVNTNGTPCGTGTTGTTTCKTTVTLGAGQTIWVTWHLAYAKIGKNVSTVAAGGCPGSELIRATCTVNDSSSGDQLTTCTATASGYLKKQ